MVSFGGKKDGVGAFWLGRAVGFDPLVALLRKLGVSPAEVETALQVLMAEPHHDPERELARFDLQLGAWQEFARHLGLAVERGFGFG